MKPRTPNSPKVKELLYTTTLKFITKPLLPTPSFPAIFFYITQLTRGQASVLCSDGLAVGKCRFQIARNDTECDVYVILFSCIFS